MKYLSKRMSRLEFRLPEIERKWTQPIHNYGLIMNKFMLMFESRIQI
jgi:hypothetical protein